MNNISGITYYKLTEGYSGDRLKNCGLTGIEIDSNFYFLRGYDIESFKYDYNENVLKIERVNGDVFELKNIGNTINVEESYYDAQNGVFHLSINGVDTPFSGFTIDNDIKEIKVLSDSSINGNGSKEKPLSVSETLKTGFYAPVDRFIDTTLENNTLPTSGVKYGERVLTKESISTYGYLYNFNSVKEIENYLKSEGSQWRVPSNEDWGEMLNAVEICDSDRTHNLNTLSNADLGKYAGAILKSDNDEWEFSEDVTPKERFIKKLGLNVLPAGTPNPLRLTNNDLFGVCTGFWSNTEVTNSDVFVRLFEFNKDTVRLQAERNDGYFSLRLVKDIDLGVNPIEIIGNLPYSTVLMPYVKVDENGSIVEEGVRAWTEQNISLPVFNPASKFVAVEKDTNVIFKYFINYWNGEVWEKREFINNDMVIIGTGPDGTLNEEWQLIDGTLYRRAKEIIDELHSFVEEEALIRENSDKDIINKINEEVIKINEDIANVSDNLIKETNNRIENETAINSRIDGVIEEVGAGFNTINEIINNNKNAVNEALTSLEEKIDNVEGQVLTNINDISALNTNLTNEIDERIKANDTINSRIDDVIAETEASFNDVNTKIEKEVNDRVESENVINSRIDGLIEDVESKFNTTNDRIDEEVLKINEDIANIVTDLNNEVNNRTESENTINSRIDGVINETETKFISLNEKLENEKNTRIESDNKLQELINEEVINREESCQVISGKVIEEVARLDSLIVNERNTSENEKNELNALIAKNAITAITSPRGTVLKTIDVAEDGTSITIDVNVDEDNGFIRVNKDGKLTDSAVTLYIQSVKTEIDGKIDLLNNDVKYINSDIITINQDIKTIEENIDNLDNKINEEVSRAKDAENNLEASLNKETNRALAAENEIKNLIGEGYVNLSITHKINENEAKIEILNERINTNDSDIKEVEEKLNAFFYDAEISGQTVDTLVEIQKYISEDSGAAQIMLENIASAQTTADLALTKNDETNKRIDTLDYNNLYEDGTYVSEVSQQNGLIQVQRLKFSEVNEIIGIKDDITELNANLSLLDLSTKNEIASLKNEVNDSLNNLEAEINSGVNEFNQALSTLDSYTKNEITSLHDDIVGINNTLTNLDNATKDEINSLRGEVNTSLNNLEAQINGEINNVNDALTSLDNTTKDEINSLREEVNTSLDNLEAQITNNESVTTEELTKLNNKINDIETNLSTINSKIAKIESILNKLLGTNELPSDESIIEPYINNVDTDVYLVNNVQTTKLDINVSENENGIGQKMSINMKGLDELANIDAK